MSTKTCFKCKRVLDLSSFYKHPQTADGHLNKCIECTKRDVAEHREKNRAKISEYERRRSKSVERVEKRSCYAKTSRLRSPEKYMATRKSGNAMRDGRLVRKPCEVCGSTHGVQGHHRNYAKPLDVVWLCRECHWKEHRRRIGG